MSNNQPHTNPAALPPGVEYRSVYGKPVLTLSGQFITFDIHIHDTAAEFGYWRFASEGNGEDDAEAYRLGLTSPEGALAWSSLDPQGPWASIMLRWHPGKRDSWKATWTGTASQHWDAIAKERSLLGLPKTAAGSTPLYPLDPDGRIEAHRRHVCGLTDQLNPPQPAEQSQQYTVIDHQQHEFSPHPHQLRPAGSYAAQNTQQQQTSVHVIHAREVRNSGAASQTSNSIPDPEQPAVDTIPPIPPSLWQKVSLPDPQPHQTNQTEDSKISEQRPRLPPRATTPPRPHQRNRTGDPNIPEQRPERPLRAPVPPQPHRTNQIGDSNIPEQRPQLPPRTPAPPTYTSTTPPTITLPPSPLVPGNTSRRSIAATRIPSQHPPDRPASQSLSSTPDTSTISANTKALDQKQIMSLSLKDQSNTPATLRGVGNPVTDDSTGLLRTEKSIKTADVTVVRPSPRTVPGPVVTRAGTGNKSGFTQRSVNTPMRPVLPDIPLEIPEIQARYNHEDEFNTRMMSLTEVVPCMLCGGTKNHTPGCYVADFPSSTQRVYTEPYLADLAELTSRNDPINYPAGKAPPPVRELEPIEHIIGGLSRIIKSLPIFQNDSVLQNVPDELLPIMWALRTSTDCTLVTSDGEIYAPEHLVWADSSEEDNDHGGNEDDLA